MNDTISNRRIPTEYLPDGWRQMERNEIRTEEDRFIQWGPGDAITVQIPSIIGIKIPHCLGNCAYIRKVSA